jgi:alkylation response protein AidB-like acyl-CoA dehydrogenase
VLVGQPELTKVDVLEDDSRGDPKVAVAWLRSHHDEWSRLPQPGAGATLERWQRFAAIARRDLSLARLAEGHADAVAILSELGDGRLPEGTCWGVWAAEPGRLRAEPHPGGWRLAGVKRWCSGSTGLDRALVTATAPDGPRLFAVDTASVRPVHGSWNPIGMLASGSDTIEFDTVVTRAAEVAGPDAYVNRPGFWMGAMGVAACWFGGALGVADLLEQSVSDTDVDDRPHVVNARGRVRSRLDGAAAALTAAAHWLDSRPRRPDEIRPLALSLRLLVDELARAVLEDVTVTGGSSALAFEPVHARRVVDLTVYLRQLDRHHAESELGAEIPTAWPW